MKEKVEMSHKVVFLNSNMLTATIILNILLFGEKKDYQNTLHYKKKRSKLRQLNLLMLIKCCLFTQETVILIAIKHHKTFHLNLFGSLIKLAFAGAG